MNISQIFATADRHLNAVHTTAATFKFVTQFWQSDIDLGNSAEIILDRIALLESRMVREHGWKR